MLLRRFVAASVALASLFLGSTALAATVPESDLLELYMKGYIQGRPAFTEYYDSLPSAYFSGLPAMKTANFDHSNCKPILPEHIARLGLEAPAGFEPAKYDCSRPKQKPSSARLPLYRYVPLYPLLNGGTIRFVTTDGQVHSFQVAPPNSKLHPYDIRFDTTSVRVNPWSVPNN